MTKPGESYSITGPGDVTDTIPLEAVVVTSERPYQVIELQALRRR